MVLEQQVDVVIVASPDHSHADLVVRAMEAGAVVVVEKPLTIDAETCRRITSAVERTGRNVVMTVDFRYSPRNSVLKEGDRLGSQRCGHVGALRVGAGHRERR